MTSTTQALAAIVSTYYGLASLAAFVTFAWDKRAARLEMWRISERTLHALTLAGGFLGSLLAMRLVRHKTQKLAFKVMPWVALALHAALWLGVHWLTHRPR